MSNAFNPVGVAFRRVSPRLIVTRSVGWTIFCAFLAAPWPVAAYVADLSIPAPPSWAYAVVVVFWLIGLVLVVRRVRAIGYAETEDCLMVRKGLLFRSLVAVPYGRLQYVDVSAGPIDQAFGIATVVLHTASASTDAAIPGLPKADAGLLRERLAGAGASRLAGL